jgi:2-polyprenyl-3-methyl-5-hydroxy-6-metoxy-1,4-benzoquinol methylase
MKILKYFEELILKNFPGNSKLYLWKGNSSQYWDERYKIGGNSGTGSYGLLSEFKADIINNFIIDNNINSAIEFGCGDGHQLSLINYPNYIGVDVSQKAIENCKLKFLEDSTKLFFNIDEVPEIICELSLSLEVIFHLTEDKLFEDHMKNLFNSSSSYVIIFSSNEDRKPNYFQPHIRHRRFTQWIDQYILDWKLILKIENPFKKSIKGSFSDYYIYKRINQ